MNEFVSSTEWILFAVTMGGVFLITVGIPAIWLGAHKRASEQFHRIWVPIGMYLAVVSGIAVLHDSWTDKLIIMAVMAPVTAFGSYVGYQVALMVKRALKP